MIDAEAGFILPEAPDLAVFPDADRAGLFHVLPLRLMSTGPDGAMTGQMVVSGRGAVSDDRAVSGAFWTLTLTPAPPAAERDRVAAILSADGPPARLITAEADVTVEVTLTPGHSGAARARDWRGTPLIVEGRATGPAAAALRRAWLAGLPDAAVVMVLAVTGAARGAVLGAARGAVRGAVRATVSRSHRIGWDGAQQTRAAQADLTTTRAMPYRLTRRLALDLRATQTRDCLFHTGFDPT